MVPIASGAVAVKNTLVDWMTGGDFILSSKGAMHILRNALSISL